MTIKRTLRRWLKSPVDGDALLREARLINLNGTTALLFSRSLDHDEIVAIERAWMARPYVPPTPPMAETDPGQ